MKFVLTGIAPKALVALLLVCLFAFVSTAVQAVLAHRLATSTLEAYAPKIEKQAVAFIGQALPTGDQGEKAALLAQALATNVELQYQALSRAVESQSSALSYQAAVWAIASILALVAILQSRRQVPSAA